MQKVHRAVADLTTPSRSPLGLVGSIQVVSADHAASSAGDGIEIRVVVGGPVGTPWNLVVGDQMAARIVMGAGDALGLRGFVVVVRDADAGVPIRQAAGRTAGGDGG